jgi:HEAT repeat protein
MKHFLIFLLCAGAAAGAATDDLITRMLDTRLTAAQRNNACFALRGNHSPAVIAGMREALSSTVLETCAGRSLREAGAVDELRKALHAAQPEERAVAARELGTFKRPDLIEPLAKATHDPNAVVALDAVGALGQYHDRAVLPHLLELVGTGGVVGVAALSRAAKFQDPAVLGAARATLGGKDIAIELIALHIIADRGDASDLPRLREMAAKSEPLQSRGRGFGLMPPIDLARAARAAMDAINHRAEPPKRGA